jgi:hypothetical protein
MEIASENGNIPVSKRIFDVATFDVIYSPSSKSLWIGRPQDFYFSLNNRLYSANILGTSLTIRGASIVSDESMIIQNAEKWIEFFKIGKSDWYDLNATNSCSFELSNIFGSGFFKKNPATIKWMKITGISFQKEAFTISFNTITSNVAQSSSFKVTFSNDLELKSASTGPEEKDIPIMLDARISKNNEQLSWSVHNASIVTTNGIISMRSYTKDFFSGVVNDGMGKSANKPSIPFTPGVRIIILDNGEVWVGPENAKLIMIGDQLTGFHHYTLKGQILIFSGQKAKLSADNKLRKDEFKSLLVDIENKAALGHLFVDHVLHIAQIFSQDKTLNLSEGIRLLSASINKEKDIIDLKITVDGDVRDRCIRLALDYYFRVVSATRSNN